MHTNLSKNVSLQKIFHTNFQLTELPTLMEMCILHKDMHCLYLPHSGGSSVTVAEATSVADWFLKK